MTTQFAEPVRVARAGTSHWRQPKTLIVSVAGSSGSGKTALLEAATQRLCHEFRTAVVVANLASTRDAERLRKFAQFVCEVQAADLSLDRLSDLLAPQSILDFDLLLVESIAGLIETAGNDLAPMMRVGVFGVSGGDDQAAKHPQRVREADLLLLTKVDLLPHVRFDMNVFVSDVRELNRSVPLLEVSISAGTGIDDWINWLRRSIQLQCSGDAARRAQPAPDYFFG